jgi:predicted PurR-regulated permease PerM
MTESERGFLVKVLMAIGAAGAALAVWTLRDVILLLFNAVLVSLFLQALYGPLVRVGLDRRSAFVLVVAALVVVIGFGGAFFGLRIKQQVAEAAQLLPQALSGLEAQLRGSVIGDRIVSSASSMNLQAAIPALLHLPGYALSLTTALAEALLVVVGGLFIAATPRTYLAGLLAMPPSPLRQPLGAYLEDVGALLRKWLVAQFIAMITVGLMTGLGLWLLGVPAAGAVGMFAAAAEFIPIVGPIAAAVPALLLASVQGLGMVGWTLLMVVVIQQVESNLLVPLLHRQIVRLQPLLVLFALLAFQVLFGFLGLVLAVPLTIVLKTALDRYLRRAPAEPAAAQRERASHGKPG